MADDLGDEWWLDNSVENEGNNAEIDEISDNDKSKKTNKRKKLKSQEYEDSGQVIEGNEDGTKNTKKSKRRKRKLKEETVEQSMNGNDVVESFWSSFNKCVEGKLTTLEMEDLSIDDKMFVTDSTIHTGTLDELSSYLSTTLPKWSKLVGKVDAKPENGRPILLLVTSAASRATDLVRASTEFKQKAKVMKLFSKHLKMEEQETYLKNNVVHFGIGTPNRIYKLIQSGALSLSKLRVVVLDWTWRDAKQRRLMDIPEIQQDMVVLLKDVILDRAKEQITKIGLF